MLHRAIGDHSWTFYSVPQSMENGILIEPRDVSDGLERIFSVATKILFSIAAADMYTAAIGDMSSIST